MSNYINTVISICLAFILLIIAPLTFVSISQFDTSKRLVHNDTVTFLDTMQDKAYVTGQDMSDYTLKVNSHGITLDVTMTAYTLASSKDIDGNPITLKLMKYNDFDTLDKQDVRLFNKGDLVTIEVKEVGISGIRRLMYKILNLDMGPFDYSMSVVVQ
jgi:hypothetical protein